MRQYLRIEVWSEEDLDEMLAFTPLWDVLGEGARSTTQKVVEELRNEYDGTLFRDDIIQFSFATSTKRGWIYWDWYLSPLINVSDLIWGEL